MCGGVPDNPAPLLFWWSWWEHTDADSVWMYILVQLIANISMVTFLPLGLLVRFAVINPMKVNVSLICWCRSRWTFLCWQFARRCHGAVHNKPRDSFLKTNDYFLVLSMKLVANILMMTIDSLPVHMLVQLRMSRPTTVWLYIYVGAAHTESPSDTACLTVSLFTCWSSS